jgi:sulfide:quinone oxidoreductase
MARTAARHSVRSMDTQPLRVVIVGAGVAGLETLIGLHSIAGPRVRVTLVAPEREFAYRPLSVGEPFGMGPPRSYELGPIAADFGAELVAGRLDRVSEAGRRIFLADGSELPFDALVLALGARQEPVWPHVLTFRDRRDSGDMHELVDEVARGDTQSVAFVVPHGVSWPLPLYELALMTARHAESRGREPELAVFTPERDALDLFGREASRDVAAELEQAGVRVARSATVDVTAMGDVVLPHEEWPLRFERVVAIPRLRGPAPAGVPHDHDGFVPIDPHGLVRGTRSIFAAGDGTDFPVKQGGIAAQQADAVAEAIAKVAGAGNSPRPFTAVVRAQLLTGAKPRFLRGDVSPRATAISEASETPLWWPATKIAGAHLAPYLASLDGPVPDATPDEGDHLVSAAAWIEESPYGE